MRLRFWRKETPLFGWGPERTPVSVTRLPDRMLSFAGRVSPLEIVATVLNESGATSVGRVLRHENYLDE